MSSVRGVRIMPGVRGMQIMPGVGVLFHQITEIECVACIKYANACGCVDHDG